MADKSGQAFARAEPVTWQCRNCGFVHCGSDAPGTCPACIHPQAHFEIVAENG